MDIISSEAVRQASREMYDFLIFLSIPKCSPLLHIGLLHLILCEAIIRKVMKGALGRIVIFKRCYSKTSLFCLILTLSLKEAIATPCGGMKKQRLYTDLQPDA